MAVAQISDKDKLAALIRQRDQLNEQIKALQSGGSQALRDTKQKQTPNLSGGPGQNKPPFKIEGCFGNPTMRANTNAGVANARVGDTIRRNNGEVVKLSKGDIESARQNTGFNERFANQANQKSFKVTDPRDPRYGQTVDYTSKRGDNWQKYVNRKLNGKMIGNESAADYLNRRVQEEMQNNPGMSDKDLKKRLRVIEGEMRNAGVKFDISGSMTDRQMAKLLNGMDWSQAQPEQTPPAPAPQPTPVAAAASAPEPQKIEGYTGTQQERYDKINAQVQDDKKKADFEAMNQHKQDYFANKSMNGKAAANERNGYPEETQQERYDKVNAQVQDDKKKAEFDAAAKHKQDYFANKSANSKAAATSPRKITQTPAQAAEQQRAMSMMHWDPVQRMYVPN